MSWLLFLILAALHPVVFIFIGLRSKTWGLRLVLWALLSIPAILYCWPYYQIKSEHARMCADVGGLRVLIPPEKVDRVRLVGDRYNSTDSKALLWQFFPQLQLVESNSGKRASDGKEIKDYFSYTAVVNPRAGLPMDKDSRKKPKLIFSEANVHTLDPTVFEISVHESDIPHGTIKETRLGRSGTTYAKYTELVHWWTGIHYPDALPTWRCPDQRQPDAVILPYEPLAKLILK